MNLRPQRRGAGPRRGRRARQIPQEVLSDRRIVAESPWAATNLTVLL